MAAESNTTKQLVHDLQPVSPVRLPFSIGLCLAIQVVAVLLGSYASGFRLDLAERLMEPSFVIVLSALIVGAVASAVVALRSAIPGRGAGNRTSGLLVALPVMLALIVGILAPWGGRWTSLPQIWGGCAGCVALSSTSAVVPWIVVMILVGRLAPLKYLRSGVYAGLAAFLVGAIVTQLHCPAGDAYHLVIGHYLPVSVLSAATSIFAAWVLRLRVG